MGPWVVYLLFFCSGISGLIYQLAWVRQFGHAFGNTIHSTSLVVAIFMLGLGLGGYLAGVWADRRYESGPTLLKAYAIAEGLLAILALAVTLTLPFLGGVVARLSSYTTTVEGWQVLTVGSYVARAVIALALMTPITLIMGATLTLLIRYLLRADIGAAGWKIALLYGANTAGAALGALLTDVMLIPLLGVRGSQLVAVGLNVLAGGAAWILGIRHSKPVAPEAGPRSAEPARARAAPTLAIAERGVMTSVGVALALSGFVVMGMEILWLRHATLLLGGFRAVFAMTMTVLLLGMGAGAWFGGWVHRQWDRPGDALVLAQALFVALALLGVAAADITSLEARGDAVMATLGGLAPWRRTLTELWYTARPLLLEVGLPSFVAGCAFPLANGVVQRVQSVVGRRAGTLYLANTVGAVAGSLAAGYLLLPRLGLQAAAFALACVGAVAILPLLRVSRRSSAAAAALLAVAPLAWWTTLPVDYLLQRTRARQLAGERLVAASEGLTEVVNVVEVRGRGRALITNGHAMSSTAVLDQRYMRAMAHLPLLSMDAPARVLVIGFGVGNTAHAATLHTSVRQVDVVDLSRHVLEQAHYFRDANHDVLGDAKVSVYVNDGRQHLRMIPPGSYDLITLEPPPIAYAGVAALYSQEFYELARSRLTAGGYISQWLPAYQVPDASSLAMVRAFVNVFPQAVLLSGTQAELLLVGTAGPRIEIDPLRLERALSQQRAVRDDLVRLDLGTPREIVGTFIGSAATLARATRGVAAVVDDRPLQEHAVLSGLSTGHGAPAALYDLADAAAWCPRCFDGGEGARRVTGLDLYFGMLQEAYMAPAAPRPDRPPLLLGSAYLAAVVPDTAEVHNVLGVDHLRKGRHEDAARQFEEALRRDPASSRARSNLANVRSEEGSTLLEARRFAEAALKLREAIELAPDLVDAHNDLGVALASIGRVDEALSHFQRAVSLSPRHAAAQRNLAAAAAAIRQ